MFYKMGDVDNKDKLRQWLQDYDEQHACPPFQITPVTVSLSDRDTCWDFYSNNSRWAPSDASMWFIKDSNGSQGTHIKLRTRHQIEAMCRAQKSAFFSRREEGVGEKPSTSFKAVSANCKCASQKNRKKQAAGQV